MLGEFCRGLVGERACRANFFPYTRTVASYHRLRGALHAGNRGGFALHEALWLRVAGVSEPHVVQFPDWCLSVRGVVPKVQTTLMNNADNGLLWARWSASSTAVARMVCVLAEVLVAGPFYWRC